MNYPNAQATLVRAGTETISKQVVPAFIHPLTGRRIVLIHDLFVSIEGARLAKREFYPAHPTISAVMRREGLVGAAIPVDLQGKDATLTSAQQLAQAILHRLVETGVESKLSEVH